VQVGPRPIGRIRVYPWVCGQQLGSWKVKTTDKSLRGHIRKQERCGLFVLDVPSSPQSVCVSDVSAERCRLNWKPPTDDGGSEIIGMTFEAYGFL